MKYENYISLVNELLGLFGRLPSFASKTEMRANIEKILYTHEIGIDAYHKAPVAGDLAELSQSQVVIDTCDYVIKAAARVGIEGDVTQTRQANVMHVADRMAAEIEANRKGVKAAAAHPGHRLNPKDWPEFRPEESKLADEYQVLRDVLDRAYQQAATGKGAERHANGQSFEQQPMQTLSNLLDSNTGLLFQAMKKIQESSRMPHYRVRERELLGAINYIAGAIIWDANHAEPEGE